MAHFANIRGTKEFKRFDYGKEENLLLYEEETPPIIDLSQVGSQVPWAFFIGKQDPHATQEATHWICDQLPNVYHYREIQNHDHASFNFGLDMSFVVEMIELLKDKNPQPIHLATKIEINKIL